MANLCREDNQQSVDITIRYEADKIRVDIDMNSGKAYFFTE